MRHLSTYIRDNRRYGKAYFDLQQAASALNISPNAARAAVHRLRAKGELVSPARGFYIAVPPEHQVNGSPPAAEVIPTLMKYLKADYYVSLLTGAAYHGAAHQKVFYFQVVSNKRMGPILRLGRLVIQFAYKKDLKGLPMRDWTVRSGYLKLASPELVALDLFLYPDKCLGLNHIATVLSELIEEVDEDKLIELAEMTGEIFWLQRFGYILSQIDPVEEEKTQSIMARLERYLADKIRHFLPLAPELPTKGHPRIKKWGIIANTTVESDI